MPRRKRLKRCSKCGSWEKVNPRSGLCPTCAISKVQESIKQLKEKKGPYYEKWRKGLIANIQGDNEEA